MGHFQVAHSLIDAMLRGEFTGWPVQLPGRRFTMPTHGNVADPSKFYAYDFEYEDNTPGNFGADDTRHRWLEGRLIFQVGQQQDSGREVVDGFCSRLDALSDAVTLTTSGRFAFYGVVPSGADEMVDKAQQGWYVLGVYLPFRRAAQLSQEDCVTVAGVGSTSRSITTTSPHGLSVRDWVGFDGTQWRRVRAIEGEPRCEGVVSEVLDSTTFSLTVGGAVRIPAHGWPLGSLYLSQSVSGAGSTAPDSGVSRLLATVYDADNLIVLSLSEVLL